MLPYLELVGIQEQESFKVWTQGHPYETARWHFHPEFQPPVPGLEVHAGPQFRRCHRLNAASETSG